MLGPVAGNRGGRRSTGPRARTGGRWWLLLAGRSVVAVVSLLVLSVTGYVWSQYQDLLRGIGRSDALRGAVAVRGTAVGSAGGETNILVMGLDSRLDENGKALPAEIYQALHAGDQQVGGYNANVLMLVHLPAETGAATVISIPRDDYVALPGSPDGVAKGKIKQAYGLAFDQENRRLVAAGVRDPMSLEQRSRDAGRREEIDTVSQFLGGVPIDHFIEVTMVGFYQLAQVVAPITVCVNEDTKDSYSGADFHRGYQQINAAQALAFVRQRRDYSHPQLNFTDLDRERRQQAFLASLAYQLKQAGTVLNPVRLRALIEVATQNIATDTGLDVLSLAQQAAILSGGSISFTTLPIAGFGTDPRGEDVNIVNLPQIQALVHTLIGDHIPPPVASTPTSAPSGATGAQSGIVDVTNATTRDGLAAGLEHALAFTGFTAGLASTARQQRATTTIYYPSAGSASAARTLATMLGAAPTAVDPTVPHGHLRVVLGADYIPPANLSAPVPGHGSGSPAPDSHAPLTEPHTITTSAIPCVN